MPQSLSVVYLHLIFSTKERRPLLRDKPQRFSVSHSRLESMIRYIREQEEHQLKMTSRTNCAPCCASMRCTGTTDTYGIKIARLHAPQPLRG